MIIYRAGNKVRKESEGAYRLHSFYYCYDGNDVSSFQLNLQNKVRIFIDSGAFSAKAKREKIDINKYIEFLKRYEHKLEAYANLDVIGDAEGTWKNHQLLKKAGLNPIPVFHMGEDYKWLEHYIDSGEEYIALGGLVIKDKCLTPYLDHLWSKYLTDKDGWPRVRVHGFGLTNFKLMWRYPWYSVDSTSWIMTSRNGHVFVPYKVDGEWCYSRMPYKISVSVINPKATAVHYEDLSVNEKKEFEEYVKAKGCNIGQSSYRKEPRTYKLKENEKWVGFKRAGMKMRIVETIIEPGLRNSYVMRDTLNSQYFIDLQNAMPKYPWRFTKRKQLRGFGF
jgi:hypothetical protein